tara:strand:- start:473 stop:583 length:111 start_codon:yes stop_codon:yes gene_type:complete
MFKDEGERGGGVDEVDEEPQREEDAILTTTYSQLPQ